MKTRILIVGHVWPEPGSSAAGSRMEALIRGSQTLGWETTFCSASKRGDLSLDLESMGIGSLTIKLNDPSLQVAVSQIDPDVVIFDRFMTEEKFGWRVEEACPGAIRILDTVDLHLLRQAREITSRVDRAPDFREWSHEVALREIGSIFRSDLTLVLSEEEMNLLDATFRVPEELIMHFPLLFANGPDLTFSGFDQRNGYRTIGNFRHAPNMDGVRWLSDEIWDQIRDGLPGAHLHVYGAYPPANAMAMNDSARGFESRGWARDSRAAIRSGRVLLAPLRFGAGLKGKIVEAMLTGTPVVTTGVGAEGLGIPRDFPGFVADDADSFARAAIRLHEDQELWTSCQMHCPTQSRPFTDITGWCDRLASRVEPLRRSLTSHRQRNIIGAMLRHDLHRSTRYMSKWIEEKSLRRKLDGLRE